MNNLAKIPNLAQKKNIRDDYEFISIEGTISLSVWNDFQNRHGEYGSLKAPDNTNRVFRLNIGGDMILDEPQITDSHVNAYNYTMENAEAVKNSILLSLLDRMPDVKDIRQFRDLICLSSVHLMNVEKDGMAYVGYEFKCTWDVDHGLGFMTHKDRICKIGSADMSFLTWVAEEDLEANEGKIFSI